MAITATYEFPVAGGSSPPALGVAVDIVQATINNDGTGGAYVFTHNLVVSSADLALGLPCVEFEPISTNAANGTIVCAITAKAANTVSLNFAAIAGNVRIRVSRPNTEIR